MTDCFNKVLLLLRYFYLKKATHGYSEHPAEYHQG